MAENNTQAVEVNQQEQSQATTVNAQTDQNKQPGEKETVNRSELDSLIGKAVETALKNNDTKWQKVLDEKVAETKTQAEAYAKMTADEKRKAEQDAERKKFEEEKAAFEKEKLLVEVKSDLQSQSLPIAFASALVNISDVGQIKETITELKKTWDAEITEAIKSKARQTTPIEGGQSIVGGKELNIGKMAREARIIK